MNLAVDEIKLRALSTGSTPGSPGFLRVHEGWKFVTTKTVPVALCIIALLFWAAPLRAADPTSSAVDSSELAAFMQKWKAAADHPMNFPADPKEQKLLIPAIAQDPAGPWAHFLQLELAVSRYEFGNAPAAKRHELAAAALRRLREADAAIPNALGGKLDEDLQATRAELQPLAFFWGMEAGENLPGMRKDAEQLLAAALQKKDWNQGN